MLPEIWLWQPEGGRWEWAAVGSRYRRQVKHFGDVVLNRCSSYVFQTATKYFHLLASTNEHASKLKVVSGLGFILLSFFPSILGAVWRYGPCDVHVGRNRREQTRPKTSAQARKQRQHGLQLPGQDQQERSIRLCAGRDETCRGKSLCRQQQMNTPCVIRMDCLLLLLL